MLWRDSKTIAAIKQICGTETTIQGCPNSKGSVRAASEVNQSINVCFSLLEHQMRWDPLAVNKRAVNFES